MARFQRNLRHNLFVCFPECIVLINQPPMLHEQCKSAKPAAFGHDNAIAAMCRHLNLGRQPMRGPA